VLHAQPAHYTLDGAHGVANPKGLHAEALGVDVHVTLAEGAPVRNLIEAVQTAHLDVEGVVASPLAAAYACLTRIIVDHVHGEPSARLSSHVSP